MLAAIRRASSRRCALTRQRYSESSGDSIDRFNAQRFDSSSSAGSYLNQLKFHRRSLFKYVWERTYVPLISVVREGAPRDTCNDPGEHILCLSPEPHLGVRQRRDWSGPQRTLSSSRRTADQITRAGQGTRGRRKQPIALSAHAYRETGRNRRQVLVSLCATS
jgi:hypothetical protein